MPTEALILRRDFPLPVTFADLRRAAIITMSKQWELGDWHSAIKEATGAVDVVYAVIDGREVMVASVHDKSWASSREFVRHGMRAADFNDLCIKADEANYWQRPHEVRHTLEEPMMSTHTMARIAGNSFIVAGSK